MTQIYRATVLVNGEIRDVVDSSEYDLLRMYIKDVLWRFDIRCGIGSAPEPSKPHRYVGTQDRVLEVTCVPCPLTELRLAAAALLRRLDAITTEEFSLGAEKPEREALRKLVSKGE
jgi:hypothetical protein